MQSIDHTVGPEASREEIIDLVPLLEEELSSASDSSSSSIDSKSSHSVQSCISESEDFGDSDDCSSSKILSYTSDHLPAPQYFTFENGRNGELVQGNKFQPDYHESANTKRSTPRNVERIRKAFAAARRGDFSSSGSRRSLDSQRAMADHSTSTEKDNTKLSTLTDSRSSALREQAAVARSRPSQTSPQTKFPLEIALPALDHLEQKQEGQNQSLRNNAAVSTNGAPELR